MRAGHNFSDLMQDAAMWSTWWACDQTRVDQNLQRGGPHLPMPIVWQILLMEASLSRLPVFGLDRLIEQRRNPGRYHIIEAEGGGGIDYEPLLASHWARHVCRACLTRAQRKCRVPRPDETTAPRRCHESTYFHPTALWSEMSNELGILKFFFHDAVCQWGHR